MRYCGGRHHCAPTEYLIQNRHQHHVEGPEQFYRWRRGITVKEMRERRHPER